MSGVTPPQERDSWSTLSLCILSCVALPNRKICEPNVAPTDTLTSAHLRGELDVMVEVSKKVAMLVGS